MEGMAVEAAMATAAAATSQVGKYNSDEGIMRNS